MKTITHDTLASAAETMARMLLEELRWAGFSTTHMDLDTFAADVSARSGIADSWSLAAGIIPVLVEECVL